MCSPRASVHERLGANINVLVGMKVNRIVCVLFGIETGLPLSRTALRVGVIGITVRARSIPRPSTLLTIRPEDLLLAGVRSRAFISVPDLAVHEFEQWPHVGQAGCHDTDGRFNACPHAGVDIVICFSQHLAPP